MDIEDAKLLGIVLGRYKDLYYVEVMFAVVLVYILYPFYNAFKKAVVKQRYLCNWYITLTKITFLQSSDVCYSRLAVLVDTEWFSFQLSRCTYVSVLLFGARRNIMLHAVTAGG